MVSSVVLLVILQIFWLQNSYEKAFLDIKRESSNLLRSTVFDLRDSMFIRSIEPINPDSVRGNTFFTTTDSFNVKFHSHDTLAYNSRVEILISSTERDDSTFNFLRPLASSIHGMAGQRNLVVRMGPDSIRLDTLAIHYQTALARSGINLPFKLRHARTLKPRLRMAGLRMHDDFDASERMRKGNIYSDTLVTERAHLNPVHAYMAIFSGMRIGIIQQIAPQILFSVFLTTIIILSFVVVYRSLRSQQRLNELKNDFISNVTHELKTPVATVSVALEALKDFHALNNPARTQEYLSIAQNELSRLTLMTDKILKASVFEKNGISFVPEKVNLDAVIKQVLESMKLIFEKRDIKVNYETTANAINVRGSEVHLTNVIYNLIDNAIKYGKDHGSIDIQLTGSTNELILSIRDTGIGIAKAYQRKIFEKFFRVPSGDIHNVKGYGLGLNYVSNVVKSHKGKIEVESDEGKGSLFTITLPLTS
jgi:two-component system, OmpR family, phosphate regulon sensor histidine kinase PhoR